MCVEEITPVLAVTGWSTQLSFWMIVIVAQLTMDINQARVMVLYFYFTIIGRRFTKIGLGCDGKPFSGLELDECGVCPNVTNYDPFSCFGCDSMC